MLRTAKMSLLIVCLAVGAVVVAGQQAAQATPPTVGSAVPPGPQVLVPVLPPESIPALIQKHIQQQIQQQIQHMPPILVPKGFPVPLGPPAWMLQRLPLIRPFPQVLPLELQRGPVDPGSLRINKRAVPDGVGGHYLVEERTWTSLGAPCREIVETHGVQGQPVVATPQTLPKTEEQVDTLPQPVPDTDEQLATQPIVPAAPQPAAPLPTDTEAPVPGTLKQAEPLVAKPIEEKPAAKLELVEVAPVVAVEEPQQPAPAATPAPVQTRGRVVGMSVSADSTKGTRVYKYSQDATGQVLEKTIHAAPIQTVPGTMTGIGVSVDSQNGTRLYRYQGTPAITPVQ
jgi:hypothetical protein